MGVDVSLSLLPALGTLFLLWYCLSQTWYGGVCLALLLSGGCLLETCFFLMEEGGGEDPGEQELGEVERGEG